MAQVKELKSEIYEVKVWIMESPGSLVVRTPLPLLGDRI